MRTIRKITPWQRMGLVLLVGMLAVGVAVACGGGTSTEGGESSATTGSTGDS